MASFKKDEMASSIPQAIEIPHLNTISLRSLQRVWKELLLVVDGELDCFWTPIEGLEASSGLKTLPFWRQKAQVSRFWTPIEGLEANDPFLSRK